MTFIIRLVIFLIRLKLHVRKGERFQFDNQKTDSVYWFTESSLNPDCKIRPPYLARMPSRSNFLTKDERWERG